jgi:hypothetical protein
MCTATYLPIGPKGFILTHSRDEKAIRPAALPPGEVPIGGHLVTFPKDPQGMGTWIASANKLTVCLLNGAFVPHQPQPPYKHSRGLVALDVFDYVSVDAFIRHYPFDGLEPFTLVLLEGGRLTELRWNGKRLSIRDKDPKRTHIWSSVTLYTTEVIQQRERWFTQWQQQISHWTVVAIRQFHKTAGDGDPRNSLRMNRQNQYFTVSLTSVLHNGDVSAMLYEDLIQPTATHQFSPYRHAAASISLA